MKNSSSTKSIAFILWFIIFCSVRYSAASNGNIISTIKNPSTDFTYRILPADIKPLYLIEVEDVKLKVDIFLLKKTKPNKKQIKKPLKTKSPGKKLRLI